MNREFYEVIIEIQQKTIEKLSTTNQSLMDLLKVNLEKSNNQETTLECRFDRYGNVVSRNGDAQGIVFTDYQVKLINEFIRQYLAN